MRPDPDQIIMPSVTEDNGTRIYDVRHDVPVTSDSNNRVTTTLAMWLLLGAVPVELRDR